MKPERKQHLLQIINSEIERLISRFKEARNTADSFAYASPSESGDRMLYRLNADLVGEVLERLRQLRDEIRNSSDDAVITITPPCYLEIEFPDGSIESFYLVRNTVTIEGVELISPNSPLGRALLHKRQGDEVVYSVGTVEKREIKVTVKVVE